MNEKEFRTDNLALCPYLSLHGLKYLRAEISLGKRDQPVVAFVFEDPHGQARDLELDFLKSEFKKYRDSFFFFRGEIERMKRQLDHLNHRKSRLDETLEKED